MRAPDRVRCTRAVRRRLSASPCSGGVACRYPGEDDSGPCLLAGLSATIDDAACGDRMAYPDRDVYTVTATGTMSGCGSGALLFGAPASDMTGTHLDCGSWTNNATDRCTPGSAAASDVATWQFRGVVEVPSGTAVGATVSVQLDALTRPNLATRSVHCE